MPSLRKLFQQDFEGHKGRPGFVGGSLPKEGSVGKIKPVATSQGTPLLLQEDSDYESSIPLPNGKLPKRLTVLDMNKNPIGTITETRGYSEKKVPGQRYVTSRKEIVEYRAETLNERIPLWERSYHSSSRQSAINWIETRR